MFRRTLVLWLALVSGNAALADKPPLSEEAAQQLFFDSGYTFCDARLLKEAWGLQMEYGAKIRTGRFLDLPRGQNRVARYVAEQRMASMGQPNQCTTWEIGLDYSQISALEAAWGLSTSDAKTRVEDEFAQNRWRGIKDKVGFMGGMDKLGYLGKLGYYDKFGVDGLGDGRDFYDLDATPFTYCDAQRVARVWGTSTGVAVRRLKMNTEQHSTADQVASMQAVREVTPTFKCEYSPDFSYNDAERVASMWAMNITDVKLRLQDKLTGGYATYLMQDLGHRSNAYEYNGTGGTNVFFTDPHQAAFNARAFTACDAEMLARLWSTTNEDAIDRAGRKLLDPGQHSALDALRADSHRLAGTDSFQCDVDDSFSADQLVAMANHWGISDADTRQRALDKLMYGDAQDSLRDAYTWQ